MMPSRKGNFPRREKKEKAQEFKTDHWKWWKDETKYVHWLSKMQGLKKLYDKRTLPFKKWTCSQSVLVFSWVPKCSKLLVFMNDAIQVQIIGRWSLLINTNTNYKKERDEMFSSFTSRLDAFQKREFHIKNREEAQIFKTDSLECRNDLIQESWTFQEGFMQKLSNPKRSASSISDIKNNLY